MNALMIKTVNNQNRNVMKIQEHAMDVLKIEIVMNPLQFVIQTLVCAMDVKTITTVPYRHQNVTQALDDALDAQMIVNVQYTRHSHIPATQPLENALNAKITVNVHHPDLNVIGTLLILVCAPSVMITVIAVPTNNVIQIQAYVKSVLIMKIARNLPQSASMPEPPVENVLDVKMNWTVQNRNQSAI